MELTVWSAISLITVLASLASAGPSGIRCYTCKDADNINKCSLESCAVDKQTCFTVKKADGTVAAQCEVPQICLQMRRLLCSNSASCSISCCEADMCNAIHTQAKRDDHDCSPCDFNPCKNGGTCVDNEDGSYSCICHEDFTGDYCESFSNPCDYQPCENGGTCVYHEDRSYSCQCPEGFIGFYCESLEPVCNPCDVIPCLNGGTCVNLRHGSYHCECPDGYIGDQCEHYNCHACDPNPCLNGGRCNPGPDCTTFKCECRGGYDGDTCENVRNPCAPNPCENGGTCHDNGDGSYTCQCAPMFEGINCEQEGICAACDPNPCINGGRCNPGRNCTTFKCECPAGYDGDICENLRDTCDPNPCENGGTCHDHGDGSYNCRCADGYEGINCEDPDDHDSSSSEPTEEFDCSGNNPCDPLLNPNQYYYPHHDPTNFVQCDAFGACWVMPCAPGTIWDPDAYTCNYP